MKGGVLGMPPCFEVHTRDLGGFLIYHQTRHTVCSGSKCVAPSNCNDSLVKIQGKETRNEPEPPCCFATQGPLAVVSGTEARSATLNSTAQRLLNHDQGAAKEGSASMELVGTKAQSPLSNKQGTEGQGSFSVNCKAMPGTNRYHMPLGNYSID